MIDIVIAAVLIVFAALGWKRGLIRTLTELAAVVLALVLSAQIDNSAAPEIVDRYLRPATHAAIEERAGEISKEAGESTRENLYKVLEAIPNGYVRDKTVEIVDNALTDGGVYAAEPLAKLGIEAADHVLDTLVRDLVRSILCAALFVVLNLAFRLIAKALRLVELLPGIRQLNEFGGALVGLGKGLILVCLAVWVLSRIGTITPEAAENSVALGLLPGWISGIGK